MPRRPAAHWRGDPTTRRARRLQKNKRCAAAIVLYPVRTWVRVASTGAGGGSTTPHTTARDVLVQSVPTPMRASPASGLRVCGVSRWRWQDAAQAVCRALPPGVGGIYIPLQTRWHARHSGSGGHVVTVGRTTGPYPGPPTGTSTSGPQHAEASAHAHHGACARSWVTRGVLAVR